MSWEAHRVLAVTWEGRAVNFLFASFSCWNASSYESKTHLRIRSVPCLVPHSFWTLCSPSAWMDRRRKLLTIMTVLVMEKIDRRGHLVSNVRLHLSEFLTSAIRCISGGIPVKEFRQCKISLLKLNRGAHMWDTLYVVNSSAHKAPSVSPLLFYQYQELCVILGKVASNLSLRLSRSGCLFFCLSCVHLLPHGNKRPCI